MRIVVFGASSRVGLYIVKEALEREHRVAAFSPRPEAFPLGHPKLDVVGGDVLDPSAVARAVSGAHGVVCALEASGKKAVAAAQSKGAENIIHGMEAAGCRRVVWLSSTGITRRGVGFFFSRGLNRIFDGRASAAERDVLGRLQRSSLNWVLVAAPGFREGAGSGRVQVSGDGPAGRFVFLGDLAAFLVEELESGRHFEEFITVFSV